MTLTKITKESNHFNKLFILLSIIIITMITLGSKATLSIIKSIYDLSISATQITQGNFENEIVINREDEIGILQESIAAMRLSMIDTIRILDVKVALKTAELEESLSKAQAADQAKSDFMSTMSHEIRTPMNGILGPLEILRMTELNEEQSDWIDAIQKSGDSLMSIINDILDFSKIEAGVIALHHLNFSIQGILNETISSNQHHAALNEKLSISCNTSPDLPSIINGDPIKTKQILNNLIGNAIKFTQEGSITVNAKLLNETKEEVTIRVEVIDTGIGIAHDKFDELFAPFTQVDQSHTREFGGTGLGLSICKKLCELMGGSIGVESEAGKGSTFQFTIPFKKATSDEVVIEQEKTSDIEPAKKPAITEKAGNQKRILLVEDNQMNIKIAKSMISIIGVECDVAINGADAVKMQARNDYDLIFMDIKMPIMNGYEATRKIRMLEHNNSTTIIALTSNAMVGDKEKCIKAGMNAYITKPVNLEKIKEQLKLFSII